MGASILTESLRRQGHEVSRLRLSRDAAPQLHLLGPAPTWGEASHAADMPRPDAWYVSTLYPRQWLDLRPMFRRMGLEPLAADRRPTDPLVAFGGQSSIAPEPIALMADVIALGDGEITGGRIAQIAALGRDHVADLAGEPGYYVPAIQSPPSTFRRVEADRYDPVPIRVGEHRRATAIEVARGCRSKCAFCSIGWAGGTYREADPAEVRAIVGRHRGSSLNLYAPDYSSISWSVDADRMLDDHGCTQRGRDARLDAADRAMAAGATIREFSFGVEGVSERMRRAIAKPLTDDRIVEVLTGPLSGVRCRLYLIPGLPGETDEDRAQFMRLLDRLVSGRTASLDVTLTLWQAVPHTPLGWDACRWPEAAHAWCLEVRRTLRDWHAQGRGQHLATAPKGTELHEHDVWLQRCPRDAVEYLLSATAARVQSGAWRDDAERAGVAVDPLLGAIEPERSSWRHVDVGVPLDRVVAARLAYARAIA
jgi:hypothetical protein